YGGKPKAQLGVRGGGNSPPAPSHSVLGDDSARRARPAALRKAEGGVARHIVLDDPGVPRMAEERPAATRRREECDRGLPPSRKRHRRLDRRTLPPRPTGLGNCCWSVR